MKISGKMYLKIKLKVTKKQNFTFRLEDPFFEKSQSVLGRGGIKLTLPQTFKG